MVSVLAQIGFGRDFFKWLIKMYNDIVSIVRVNGFLSRSFPIKHSVRQECPLSPLLYGWFLSHYCKS